MNKSLLIFFFFLTSLSAFAGSFGYSNGTCGRNNIARFGTTEKQGVAILLNEEKVKMLAGKTISGLQVVLASRNGSNLKVFVSRSLDATPLVEASGAVSKTNQWQEISLNSAYTITGNEGSLYVGLTYEIANTYSPLSFDFSKDSRGVSFAYENGKWVDTYNTQFGMPNVRLITKEELNITDMKVKSFKPSGYMKQGVEYSGMTTELSNLGSTIVKGFTAKVKVGNGETSSLNITDANIAPGQNYSLEVPTFAASEGGRLPVHVEISDIVLADGTKAADDASSDNISEEEYFFYPTDFKRNILLEAFTGQTCSNCPAGHQAEHKAVESLRAQGFNVIEVSHHTGYSADAFSMNESADYTVFYNSGGQVYAPAAMVNRWYYSLDTSSPGPVFHVSQAQIEKYAEAVNKEEAFVTVDIECSSYNETTREAELAINVNCLSKPEGTAALNILLVQDSILGYQTAGSTDSYVHNSVFRGSIINNSWGADITASLTEGEMAVFKLKYTLPEVITSTSGINLIPSKDIPTVAKNMKFVAYVARYTADNPNANEVYNCAETYLLPKATSIGMIEAECQSAAKPNGIYNLRGQKVSADYRGIVIKNGKKYLQ